MESISNPPFNPPFFLHLQVQSDDPCMQCLCKRILGTSTHCAGSAALQCVHKRSRDISMQAVWKKRLVQRKTSVSSAMRFVSVLYGGTLIAFH